MAQRLPCHNACGTLPQSALHVHNRYNPELSVLPAIHYTGRVRTMPSAIITCGFAIQLVSVVAAYRYVTGSPALAPFVWVPAVTRFLVTLTSVVIWCRRNPTKLPKLAIWLLLVGGFTFASSPSASRNTPFPVPELVGGHSAVVVCSRGVPV